jgi:hypothetical protein
MMPDVTIKRSANLGSGSVSDKTVVLSLREREIISQSEMNILN